jgi:hypothetical protein
VDGSGDEVFAASGEIAGRQKGSGYFGGVGVLHARAAVPTVVADEGADPWTIEGGSVLTGLGSYRLAADPHAPLGSVVRPAHLLLGTSNGLFERTTPGVDTTWSKVTSGPFGRATDPDNPLHVTDIRWIPKGAASRVWVGVDDQSSGGGGSSLWWADVDSGGGIGTWTQVALTMAVPAPGAPITYGGRIGLADSPAAPGILYALSIAGPWATATPAMWRIDDPGGTPAVASIGNVPPRIFTATGSGAGQQGYDLTIAADPAVAGQLIIGGAALEVVANDWNAALWLVQVQAGGPTGWQLSFTPSAPPPAPPAPQPPVQSYNGTQDPTYIGAGVHADVHCAVWTTSQAAGARHVWVGCDGGVYRSAAEGGLRTFLARNTGVGSLQPNWIASNPASLHDIVIGTQDNGTIRRVGDTVWQAAFLGDGGGTAFFASATAPVRPAVRPGVLGGRSGPSVGLRAARVSQPARRPGGERRVLVLLPAPRPRSTRGSPRRGRTTRVWCTQDGGTTFFTLPGGWIPSAAPGPTPPTRPLTPACWRAACRHPTGRWSRCAGPPRVSSSSSASGPCSCMTWWAAPPYRRRPPCDGSTALKRARQEEPAEAGVPCVRSWTDVAIANPAGAGDGTLYVATTGPEKPSSAISDDTLWWYDGSADETHRLRAAGLGSSPTSTVAPAYAVVVDPASPATVYVAPVPVCGRAPGPGRPPARRGPGRHSLTAADLAGDRSGDRQSGRGAPLAGDPVVSRCLGARPVRDHGRPAVPARPRP